MTATCELCGRKVRDDQARCSRCLDKPSTTKEEFRHRFADDPAPSQDDDHPFIDHEWE